MPQNQRLLEGEVMDVPNGDTSEVLRLRAEVDRLTRERDELRRRLSRTDAPVARLRLQLEPLYRALQGIWGELDEVAPDEDVASAEQGGASKLSPVWESWKQKLGTSAAKIIDALQQHGNLNTTQLTIVCQMDRRTVNTAIWKINKAGLIDKNAGRFSLKKI